MKINTYISFISLLFILTSNAQKNVRHDTLLRKVFSNVEIESISTITINFENELEKTINENIDSELFYQALIESLEKETELINSKSLRERLSVFNSATDNDNFLLWKSSYLESYTLHTGERTSRRLFSFNKNVKFIDFLETFSQENASIKEYYIFIINNNSFSNSHKYIKNILQKEEIKTYSELDFKIRFIIAAHFLLQDLDE